MPLLAAIVLPIGAAAQADEWMRDNMADDSLWLLRTGNLASEAAQKAVLPGATTSGTQWVMSRGDGPAYVVYFIPGRIHEVEIDTHRLAGAAGDFRLAVSTDGKLFQPLTVGAVQLDSAFGWDYRLMGSDQIPADASHLLVQFPNGSNAHRLSEVWVRFTWDDALANRFLPAPVAEVTWQDEFSMESDEELERLLAELTGMSSQPTGEILEGSGYAIKAAPTAEAILPKKEDEKTPQIAAAVADIPTIASADLALPADAEASTDPNATRHEEATSPDELKLVAGDALSSIEPSPEGALATGSVDNAESLEPPAETAPEVAANEVTETAAMDSHPLVEGADPSINIAANAGTLEVEPTVESAATEESDAVMPSGTLIKEPATEAVALSAIESAKESHREIDPHAVEIPVSEAASIVTAFEKSDESRDQFPPPEEAAIIVEIPEIEPIAQPGIAINLEAPAGPPTDEIGATVDEQEALVTTSEHVEAGQLEMASALREPTVADNAARVEFPADAAPQIVVELAQESEVSSEPAIPQAIEIVLENQTAKPVDELITPAVESPAEILIGSTPAETVGEPIPMEAETLGSTSSPVDVAATMDVPETIEAPDPVIEFSNDNSGRNPAIGDLLLDLPELPAAQADHASVSEGSAITETVKAVGVALEHLAPTNSEGSEMMQETAPPGAPGIATPQTAENQSAAVMILTDFALEPHAEVVDPETGSDATAVANPVGSDSEIPLIEVAALDESAAPESGNSSVLRELVEAISEKQSPETPQPIPANSIVEPGTLASDGQWEVSKQVVQASSAAGTLESVPAIEIGAVLLSSSADDQSQPGVSTAITHETSPSQQSDASAASTLEITITTPDSPGGDHDATGQQELPGFVGLETPIREIELIAAPMETPPPRAAREPAELVASAMETEVIESAGVPAGSTPEPASMAALESVDATIELDRIAAAEFAPEATLLPTVVNIEADATMQPDLELKLDQKDPITFASAFPVTTERDPLPASTVSDLGFADHTTVGNATSHEVTVDVVSISSTDEQESAEPVETTASRGSEPAVADATIAKVISSEPKTGTVPPVQTALSPSAANRDNPATELHEQAPEPKLPVRSRRIGPRSKMGGFGFGSG